VVVNADAMLSRSITNSETIAKRVGSPGFQYAFALILLTTGCIMMRKCFCLFAVLYAAMNLPAGEAPKYAEGTVPLHKDHAYFLKNPAPDFWLLSAHYVGQFNDYAYSAAGVTAVVNALLSANNMDAGESFRNIQQQEII
jgi:hypothetical protein